MPPMLPNGQFILPVQQRQQPLLNGPVPAGVTPTIGVDLTTQSGPSTSEAPSYGGYGRHRKRVSNLIVIHGVSLCWTHAVTYR